MMKARQSAVTVVLLVGVFLLAACGQDEQPKAMKKPVSAKTKNGDQLFSFKKLGRLFDSDADFEVVRVHFGTNREKLPAPTELVPYGPRRDSMRYGWCDISIPLAGRSQGEIPRPWFERSRGNPRKHFVLAHAREQSREEFFDTLKKKVGFAERGAVLLFVHGFNVSFRAAAFRTAQIAFDLEFEGPAVFFSWPSYDTVEDYITDYDSVRWAIPDLVRFMEDTATLAAGREIFLIAHSMGNQAVPQAVVELLTRRPDLKPRFKELILAAPDIDTAIFRCDIAPFFKNQGIGVTVYASTNDRALLAARRLRAGYPRVGDLNDGPVLEAGVETIDASEVQTDFILEHSYFADSHSILSDMHYLVNRGLRASQRHGLREVVLPNGRYWKIVKPASVVRIVTITLLASALLVAIALLGRWLWRRYGQASTAAP